VSRSVKLNGHDGVLTVDLVEVTLQLHRYKFAGRGDAQGHAERVNLDPRNNGNVVGDRLRGTRLRIVDCKYTESGIFILIRRVGDGEATALLQGGVTDLNLQTVTLEHGGAVCLEFLIAKEEGHLCWVS
jgi:hypothetical protein